MKIRPKIEGCEGFFETDTGKLVCVPMPKYAEVLLCFAERANIPFATIRLHSEDLFKEAMAVFEDAKMLGDEIARRWNVSSEILCKSSDTNSSASTNDQPVIENDESLNDCIRMLGLDPGSGIKEVADALRNKIL